MWFAICTANLMFEILVARQLLKEKTLEYRGHTLMVTGCETGASESESCFPLACGQSSSVIKQDHLSQSHDKAVSSGTGSETDDDILTYWWRPSDYAHQSKQMSSEQCFSGEVDLKSDFDPSSQSDDVKESGTSHCSSMSGETFVGDFKKSIEDDVMYETVEKCPAEASCEQFSCALKERQCRKISFSDEKLQFIYKWIVSSCLDFRAEIQVKLDKHLVKLSGTVDDIKHSEMKLYELVASFVTDRVSISETSAKLLLTEIGKAWLDTQLANENLVAVFYVKDTVPMVMTDCKEMFIRIKHVIESSLVVRRRQLEQHHVKLLQSSVWNECIESLQSSRLLQISVEYGAEIKLVVEGCADDVDVALERLGKMLGENSRISHSIKLRRGVYRVLSLAKYEIQLEAKYVTNCVLVLSFFVIAEMVNTNKGVKGHMNNSTTIT